MILFLNKAFSSPTNVTRPYILDIKKIGKNDPMTNKKSFAQIAKSTEAKELEEMKSKYDELNSAYKGMSLFLESKSLFESEKDIEAQNKLKGLKNHLKRQRKQINDKENFINKLRGIISKHEETIKGNHNTCKGTLDQFDSSKVIQDLSSQAACMTASITMSQNQILLHQQENMQLRQLLTGQEQQIFEQQNYIEYLQALLSQNGIAF